MANWSIARCGICGRPAELVVRRVGRRRKMYHVECTRNITHGGYIEYTNEKQAILNWNAQAQNDYARMLSRRRNSERYDYYY